MNEGHFQRRVFLAIRAGHSQRREIAAACGISLPQATKACAYLQMAGRIERRGSDRTATWHALPGASAPKDGRGRSPGSRNRARNLGPSILAMNRAKYGPHWSPRARTQHPLALAWPMPGGD